MGEGDGEGRVGGEVQAGVAFAPVFYYGDVDGSGGAGAVDCLVGGGHGGGGGEIPECRERWDVADVVLCGRLLVKQMIERNKE